MLNYKRFTIVKIIYLSRLNAYIFKTFIHKLINELHIIRNFIRLNFIKQIKIG